jgi:hypothetical protein
VRPVRDRAGMGALVKRLLSLWSCLFGAVLVALVAMPGLAAAAPVLSESWESGNLDGWTLAQPGTGADNFWHVLANPETISVRSPEINPNLVTLPDPGNLPAAVGGTHVAWFGLDANGTYCASADYANQPPKNGCTSDAMPVGSLLSPSFSLASAGHATLTFRSWFEVEDVDASGHDRMLVEYSTDGGTTWNPAGNLNPAPTGTTAPDQSVSNNGLEQSPTWQSYSFDLTPAAGQSAVQLRFTFDAGDNQFQGFRGWALDDIAVDAPMKAPVEGETVNAFAESGSVFVKLPAGAQKAAGTPVGFFPLSSLGRQIPIGSTLDTTHGTVLMLAAKDKTGGTQDGHFSKGVFKVAQPRNSPLTTVSLTRTGLNSCSRLPRGGSPKRARSARARSRSLFSRVHGRFRTRGRNSSATVRGTEYLVKDTCAGTLTHVMRGVVKVRDFALTKNVTVRAGHKYFARAPK